MSTTANSGMMTEEEFLQHSMDDQKAFELAHAAWEGSDEDFLEHYGKKGMKWGHRMASAPKKTADGRDVKSRKELRALDKASEKRDNATRDKGIDDARERSKWGGQNDKDWKQAKTQFKSDKKVIGRAEASKALQKVKDRIVADNVTSQQYKSGKESTTAALVALGGLTLLAYAGSR